ncbi:MAG: hypothetical protein ACQEQU_09065 [Spirochaetota bacterium]
METVSDLISSIVSFFIILLPVLYLLRSRSNRRQEGQEEGRPKNSPSIFKRLQEVRQLSDEDIFISPEEEAREAAPPETGQRAPAEEARTGRRAATASSTAGRTGSSPRWSEVSSVASERVQAKTSPLERIESYPIGQRAILFSEVLGPPKALRDDNHTLHE